MKYSSALLAIGRAGTHGEEVIAGPAAGPEVGAGRHRKMRAEAIHTFAARRRNGRRLAPPLFDRMKSLMRGAISARKRRPLKTP